MRLGGVAAKYSRGAGDGRDGGGRYQDIETEWDLSKIGGETWGEIERDWD